MLALGGASMSSPHLPLLPTQIYTACLLMDVTAEAYCWRLGWFCPRVRLEKKRGREGDRTCYNSWKEEQRSGSQLGDLPDKALKAIDKSCPV